MIRKQQPQDALMEQRDLRSPALDRLYAQEDRILKLAQYHREQERRYSNSHPDIATWHHRFADELEVVITGSTVRRDAW